MKYKIRHELRSKLAAAENLENLPLESYDHIFLVRDEEEKPDKKIVAEVIQMQAILAQRQKQGRFDPVCEIGEKNTVNELFQRGITNYVNTKLILAKALPKLVPPPADMLRIRACIKRQRSVSAPPSRGTFMISACES